MTLLVLAALAAVASAVSASLFIVNLALYRRPLEARNRVVPAISVLIPARNEERSIRAAVESVLQSTGVVIEVIVMDDSSTDRTPEIVSAIAQRDPRVRLKHAPALPLGWNGKQHACWVLAGSSSYPLLCFVDADVRLEPAALSQMAGFLESSRASLVSGFPSQETGTVLEWLLLPLIHFVLLGFLPLWGMRRSTSPAFAAGCGQFLLVHRTAYTSSGGHAAIRTTMHDGLLLPRLLRQHGCKTDLADLTGLATCRMYLSAGQVWRGLAKNATEGLAAPTRILPFTLLLLVGQVLPFGLAIELLVHPTRLPVEILTGFAVGASCLPRLIGTFKYRQPLRSTILHPVGILLLLVLQWYAFLRKASGRQATWKERAYPAG